MQVFKGEGAPFTNTSGHRTITFAPSLSPLVTQVLPRTLSEVD